MTNFIQTDMLTVGDYLAQTKEIRVPEYQRSYAWTDDEVSQLWEDFLDSMDNKQPDYFIGPIVVKTASVGATVEVIDGQQRLTTVLIIIGVLQRIFRTNGDPQRATLLSEKYFGEKDFVTLKPSEKFVMNEENSDTFRRYVAQEASREQIKNEQKKYIKKNSNYLLLQSILVVWDQLDHLAGESADLKKLMEFYAYLTQHVQILVLSVEDEADAYTIFETLNDRGRSLDTLDLLKNHLFSKAKSKLSEVRSKWGAVREVLQELDPKNRFLNHFWLSLHGRTPKTGLFRAMRDHIDNSSAAVAFSIELAEAARIYAALQTPSSPHWDSHEPTVSKNIATLNLLDAQQALPILLAADVCFTKVEFRKLTDILVVMAIRYTFIGEERTGVAANYYSEVPARIRSKEYSKAAHVFKHLKPIYPSDATFEAAFKVKATTDTRRARYIFAGLENKQANKEKIVNTSADVVNLEHVMPKNQNEHWAPKVTQIPADEYSYYANRLGNLALLSRAKNKSAGSDAFAKKKVEIYLTSEFATTKAIGIYDKWNRESIEARQADLATIAVKTWRIEG